MAKMQGNAGKSIVQQFPQRPHAATCGQNTVWHGMEEAQIWECLSGFPAWIPKISSKIS